MSTGASNINNKPPRGWPSLEDNNGFAIQKLRKSFISSCQTASKQTENYIKNIKNIKEFLETWILNKNLMVDYNNGVISLKAVDPSKLILILFKKIINFY